MDRPPAQPIVVGRPNPILRSERRAVADLQHRQQQAVEVGCRRSARASAERPKRAGADAARRRGGTCADVDDLMRDVGFRPATPIEAGIPASWPGTVNFISGTDKTHEA